MMWMLRLFFIGVGSNGTQYTYTWKLWNAAGTAVIRTYTGKSIVVSKTNITSKGALTCEVS